MGAGKTLFCVERAIECWKRGGVVHSNVPFYADKVAEQGWVHVDLPTDCQKWVTCEKDENGADIIGSDILVRGREGAENVVILDESAWSLHTTDQQENKKRLKALFRLVSMSRQVGLEMYFVSQSSSNIDVTIRTMVNAVIHCVNISHIRGIGPLVAFFFGTFRRTWLSPLKREKTHAESARFKPHVAAFYNTHGVGDTMRMKQSAAPVQGPIKSSAKVSPVVWLIIIAFFVALGFVVYQYKTKGYWFFPAKEDIELITAKDGKPGAAIGAAPGLLDGQAPPRLSASDAANGLFVDSLGRLFSMSPGLGKFYESFEYVPGALVLHHGDGTSTRLLIP